jgi:AcrR family transcriptional regulator
VQLPLTPILSAAADAFSDQGYHATSVRDIAARVGVTVPALYYHHANKEAILFALQDRSIDWLTELCLAALSDARTPPGRFFNLVEAVVLYMTNSTRLAALDNEIKSLSAEHRRTYSSKRRRIEQIMADEIRAGVAEGSFEVTSAEVTARALLGMFQAIAVWYDAGGPVAPQELAHQYLDVAAHTVGAHRDAARRVYTSTIMGRTAQDGPLT